MAEEENLFLCNCGGRKSKLIARKKTSEKEKRISSSISLHTMEKWREIIRVPRLHWISFFYFHASGCRKLVEALFLSCVVRYLHVARRSVSIITMIMLFLFPAQYPTFSKDFFFAGGFSSPPPHMNARWVFTGWHGMGERRQIHQLYLYFSMMTTLNVTRFFILCGKLSTVACLSVEFLSLTA